MLNHVSIANPVLATKLYIPPSPSKVVVRPRLTGQLATGTSAGYKLTLISAPAGFGKTTLVSEWIANSWHRPPGQVYNGRVAWLSLDERDSDPARFLTYLIAALQTVVENLGVGVLDSLQSSPLPLSENILTALLNEISAVPTDLVLVLDDYHVVDARPIDRALTFLLEHMPAQMHLIITTREDPAIPLSRLRARGQLIELRAADLRFTPPEAAEFINQVMNLDISEDDIAALETRTEGWIAGLQLAALSMRGHADVPGFIRAFAGDNRYIVEYLVEEVLQRQPEPVRCFLLQTSILVRLNGPLCDAVTGQTGGRARLEALQRGNFFLIPRDDKGHWYRYHQLFAEVLRMYLTAEQPDQVPALHRRASEWYQQNGLEAEAIHHALAGRDFDRAAGLIELAAPAMHRNRQESTVLGWMKALPEELFSARPVLSILYVGALMSNGAIEGVEVRLGDAERWLETTTNGRERPAGMVTTNEEEFRRLPGSIAMYRAGLALARGNLPEAMKYARRVFDVAPADDHLGRGAAAALMGLAFWTSGDLEAGYRWFAEGMAQLQVGGNISDAVGGILALADIRITQGRLHDAMRTYERALQLAGENGAAGLAVRGTADLYVGMSELEREHNDLQAAKELLRRSQEQGEHTGFPQHPYRSRVAMARLREAQGDLDAALALLDEAEPLYVSDFFPNVRPIAALKARIWTAQGKLDKALGWAREQGLSTEDDLTYLHEFEHITLARILLAHYQSARTEASVRGAVGLLARLVKAGEAGGRIGHLIEILLLQALAQQMQGDVPAALVPLERVLALAEPEGYVRIFLDEGPAMQALLVEAAARGILPAYTDRLLAAFQTGSPRRAGQFPSRAASPSQPLMEPLTERELETLRLLRTELSGPEIARELVVALSTVRTHTKSIYGKLNVNTRRAAVRRAEEVGLI